MVVDFFISFLGLSVCSLVLIFADLINSLLHLALQRISNLNLDTIIKLLG